MYALGGGKYVKSDKIFFSSMFSIAIMDLKGTTRSGF
jgi:hypothetical protein